MCKDATMTHLASHGDLPGLALIIHGQFSVLMMSFTVTDDSLSFLSGAARGLLESRPTAADDAPSLRWSIASKIERLAAEDGVSVERALVGS